MLTAAAAAAGESRRFELRVEPENVPAQWNVFHNWRLVARSASRAAGEIEEIRFDGRMPAHKHGFAVAPRVVALGGGVFRAEGVRFHMPGDWELEFAVRDRTGWERITLPFDSRSGAEIAVLKSLSLASLGPVPPDPGNRVSQSPAAAELGKRLFFDTGLSGNGRISCATCHDPEKYFTDGLRFSKGLGTPDRHTPTVVGAAYGNWFFWDGRRDSLWSQALGPLESPAEMGASRERVAAHVAGDAAYRRAFTDVFGADPAAADAAQTFAHAGKAIAAWEATLLPAESRFDRYVAAVSTGQDGGEWLNAREQAGLRLFVSEKAGCLRCHNGPLFTNQQFHNVGSGVPLEAGKTPDFGRLIGLQALTFDTFRCGSPYSDTRHCASREFAGRDNHGDLLEGAFKTPSLRQVAATAPYFHDGRYGSLRKVLEHYRRPPSGVRHELTPLWDVSDEELANLEAFLGSLSGGWRQ